MSAKAGVASDQREWWVRIAIWVAVAAGVFGIYDALNWWAAALVLVLAIGLLSLREHTWDSVVVDLLRVPAAVVVAFLALAGFDVLTNLLLKLIHLLPQAQYTRVPIGFGLVVALLVFGLVVHWYLARVGWKKWPAHPAVFGWHVPVRICLAATMAFLLIIAAPYVYGRVNKETEAVPVSKAVPSKLDVRIVGDGRRMPTPPELPLTPVLGEFKVNYSVGYAAGDRARWTLVDGTSPGEALRAISEGDGRPTAEGRPAADPEADPVLLLLADGTAPVVEDPAGLPDLPSKVGEVVRWRAVATDAAAAGTPTFALLQTSDQRRIKAWKRFVRGGEAISAQALASQTATDAAARLAVGAPTSRADFALAMTYRPVLLFDRDEPVPWPLSVAGLLSRRVVFLCHDQGLARSGCNSDPILRPEELRSGGTHLKLAFKPSFPAELRTLAHRELAAQTTEETTGGVAPAAPGDRKSGAAADEVTVGAPPPGTPPPGTVEAPAGDRAGTSPEAGTAIYVHPVSVRLNGRDLLYLDYWWYLPENPVALGAGALCGAGLVIAGITCPSHQSDWEGMTVVVDRAAAVPEVIAVQYAQHNKVVRYDWQLLRRRWERPAVEKLVAKVSDASARPLAFIAAGTHATYPTPCSDCNQVASPSVAEESHRGDLAWVGDNTSACGKASCLQMLPTEGGGARPALWNAYDGTWGEHHCLLTYYCDSGKPPTAPGHQGRYQHPARYSGFVDETWGYRAGSVAE